MSQEGTVRLLRMQHLHPLPLQRLLFSPQEILCIQKCGASFKNTYKSWFHDPGAVQAALDEAGRGRRALLQLRVDLLPEAPAPLKKILSEDSSGALLLLSSIAFPDVPGRLRQNSLAAERRCLARQLQPGSFMSLCDLVCRQALFSTLAYCESEGIYVQYNCHPTLYV